MTVRSPRAHPRATSSSWPSVGRAAERAAAVAACVHGGGTLICGEAGVGTSHLAAAVVEAIVASVPEVVHVPVAASEARRDIPLAALEQLLGDLPSSGDRDPLALAAEIGERLAREADGRPVLVHVDDAHHLDTASAEGLAALCRVGSIRLLATVRSGAGLPASIAALGKEDVVGRIDLQNLDRDEVALLLTAALGGEVVPDTVWGLLQATKGNPFFIRETVRDGLDRGDLVATDGVWAWRGVPQPGQRLADLVAAELHGIDRCEREVVELVALAEPVPVEVVAAVVGGAALDRVVELGLVVLDGGRGARAGRPVAARLRHPLYTEAVRELVPPDRRRRLFRAVSDRTEADGPGHRVESLPQLLRSVSWALECGVEPEVDRILQAARAASALDHPDYPVRMAAAALDRLASDDPRRLDAKIIRARAWRLQDQPARARRDLGDAAALLDRLGPDGIDRARERIVEVAELRADLEQYHGNDVDRALVLLAEAGSRLEALGPSTDLQGLRQRLEVSRLVRLGYAGRFLDSVPPSLDVLASGRLRPAERLLLVGPVVFGLASLGRFDEAVALAEGSLDEAVVHADEVPWALGEIVAAQFVALIWAGRVADAAAVGGGSPTSDTEEDRLRFDRAVQQVGSGQQAAAEGRWRDALAHFRAATSRFQVHDHSGILACSLAHQAKAAMALGDRAEARRLRDATARTPLRTSRTVEGQIRLSQALIAAGLGEASAGWELAEVARWAAREGQASFELGALHALVVFGLPGPDEVEADPLVRIRAVAAAVDGPVGPALLAHAEAVAAGDQELAAARGAAVARMGVWIPARTASVRLSPRQWEVASLAAAGMSSRDIADKLVVSVRTIDTHLGHVFTRLGINRRAQLPTALDAVVR